jgi:hypothetical protein
LSPHRADTTLFPFQPSPASQQEQINVTKLNHD